MGGEQKRKMPDVLIWDWAYEHERSVIARELESLPEGDLAARRRKHEVSLNYSATRATGGSRRPRWAAVSQYDRLDSE